MLISKKIIFLWSMMVFFTCQSLALETKDTDHIQKMNMEAIKAFQNYDYKSAHKAYEQLSDQMRLRRMKQFSQFMPEPPNGWKTDGEIIMPSKAILGESLLSLKIEQNYVHTETREEVELQLSLDRIGYLEKYLKHQKLDEHIQGEYKSHTYFFKPKNNRTKNNHFRLITKNNVLIQLEGEELTQQTAKLFLDKMKLEDIERTAN